MTKKNEIIKNELIDMIKKNFEDCYIDGKTVVKITFTDTERTLDDCIEAFVNGV